MYIHTAKKENAHPPKIYGLATIYARLFLFYFFMLNKFSDSVIILIYARFYGAGVYLCIFAWVVIDG